MILLDSMKLCATINGNSEICHINKLWLTLPFHSFGGEVWNYGVYVIVSEEVAKVPNSSRIPSQSVRNHNNSIFALLLPACIHLSVVMKLQLVPVSCVRRDAQILVNI